MIDRAAAAFIAPMSALERLRVVLDSGGGCGGGGGRGGQGAFPKSRRLFAHTRLTLFLYNQSSQAPAPQLLLRKRDWDTANAAFKGIRVTLSHFPGQTRRKQIRGISKKNADEIFFKDDAGRNVNVLEVSISHLPHSTD